MLSRPTGYWPSIYLGGTVATNTRYRTKKMFYACLSVDYFIAYEWCCAKRITKENAWILFYYLSLHILQLYKNWNHLGNDKISGHLIVKVCWWSKGMCCRHFRAISHSETLTARTIHSAYFSCDERWSISTHLPHFFSNALVTLL